MLDYSAVTEKYSQAKILTFVCCELHLEAEFLFSRASCIYLLKRMSNQQK